jgi:hypothetical protein
MTSYPLVVKALQFLGCWIIAFVVHPPLPTALLFSVMWFLVIEILWDTRFPW